MKYVISENRLIDFIDKYFQNNVGRLRVFPMTHINSREGDFELVDNFGKTIFTYFDYGLAIDKDLFNKLQSVFSLDNDSLGKILKKWFESRYPDSMVLSVYPFVE